MPCPRLAARASWSRAVATRRASAAAAAATLAHRRRYPTGAGAVVRTTWISASNSRDSYSIRDSAARTFTRGFICTTATSAER